MKRFDDGLKIVNKYGKDWYWPATDTECLVVLDQATTIPDVLHYADKFRTAVQAGGNMGSYPWVLAERYKTVYTFEPLAICFRCLTLNVPHDNVFKFQAALGETHKSVTMQVDPENLGAQYVRSSGSIPMLMIDDLELIDCDLIYLDIEGYELPALRGALNTIHRSRPLIVVEDKGLHRLHGFSDTDLPDFLDWEGYSLVGRVFNDSIYRYDP